MKKFEMPNIKEKRIDKIIQSLKCIESFPFHRNKQKECILQLYPGKSEKSVFRGMVIPSTRHLGLIVGFGNSIRTTCNGKLLILANQPDNPIVRAVMIEIDNKIFGFLNILLNYNKKISKFNLYDILKSATDFKSEKQLQERINSWLKILRDCNLIKYDDNLIEIVHENLVKAQYTLNIEPKINLFKKILFTSYRSLPIQKTAGSVDISILRKVVAEKYLLNYNLIVTESQFDKLLTSFPMITDEYIVTLGQPMGAEQQLFYYRGNYYRTLKINFLKGESS